MKVTVVSGDKTYEYNASKGTYVSDLLKQNNHFFSSSCSCKQNCGKCLIKTFGNVSEIKQNEKAVLSLKNSDYRLACFTQITGDATIILNNNEFSPNIINATQNITHKTIKGFKGLTVDVGTTTISIALYDEHNNLLDSDGFYNPQRIFGADIISRIETSSGANRENMKAVISETINDRLKLLCRRNNIEYNDYFNIVITGNTAMMYILAGINTDCLKKTPFKITDYLGRVFTSSEIGLSDFSNTSIYIPKTISAFIGSDITCGLTSCKNLLSNNENLIFVDIGTNGEMVLKTQKGLYCCSTAAGPAFEGAGITCGMMAHDGAINNIFISAGKICFKTISGEAPTGICGSGLIDCLAALKQLRLINKYGTFVDTIKSDKIFIGKSDVFITQDDIRALQLAKSAICAGIYTLCDEAGVNINDINKLVLAGGFGSYLNCKNAEEIGLIPKELSKKLITVGNSAANGAALFLSSNNNTNLDCLNTIKTFQLAESKFFENAFINCINFSILSIKQ